MEIGLSLDNFNSSVYQNPEWVLAITCVQISYWSKLTRGERGQARPDPKQDIIYIYVHFYKLFP